MRNTVTEAGTLNSKIQDLCMMRNHYINNNKFFLVVEGIDDVKIFDKLIDKNNVELYNAEGYVNLIDIINVLNRKQQFKNNLIGIKDADFDHILGVQNNISNLFVTDYHDLETTLMNDEFEKSLCAEFGITEKDIIINAAKELKVYSFVRLYNQIKANENSDYDGINFDCIKLGHIYNGCTPIDLGFCLSHLKSLGGNSSKADFPNNSDITSLMLLHNNVDINQLTRGHDLFYALLEKIKYLTGKKNIGYKEICLAFRFSIRKEHLEKTKLYRDINLFVTPFCTSFWVN